MFDMIWKDPKKHREFAHPEIPPKPFNDVKVEAASLLIWAEHCVECAQPLCFRECPLYIARADGNCRRMTFGMVPDYSVHGLYSYGIDCEFKKWAKLMASFNGRMYRVRTLRRIDIIDRALTDISRSLSSLLRFLPKHRRPTRIYNRLRGILLGRLPALSAIEPNAFVLECYSFLSEEIDWILQCDHNGSPVARHRFALKPGWNREIVAASDLVPPESTNLDLYFSCSRESSYRLLLTWADLVTLSDIPDAIETDLHNTDATREKPDSVGVADGRTEASAKVTIAEGRSAEPAQPAKTVKCVAWDLDNTLWRGVLIEDGLAKLTVNEEAVRIIKELDARGVIHTVLSKNDREPALQAIEHFGLKDYFVHFAISWGPKSSGLRDTALRLNLGLDAFAVVDDSAFERAEISETLPMVRVFADTSLPSLLTLPEFDLPITEASRTRRLSYLAETRREIERERLAGDNIAFLRSCQLIMRIKKPTAEGEIERCLELIQRSNQLNLSTRRYNSEAFRTLLNSPDHECYAIRCSDRFGDYGIVGFCAVRKGIVPTIVELVISCRIAKKRCEHALLRWIAIRAKEDNAKRIEASLIKTSRNGPLASVFQETPFAVIDEDENIVNYRLELDSVWEDDGIVRIETA